MFIRRLSVLTLITFMALSLVACSDSEPDDDNNGDDQNGDTPTEPVGWDGESVTYDAEDIAEFGSGTPAGTAVYDEDEDTTAIWNIDSSLDNYGGVQTPMLTLDFSKAVLFEIEVEDLYTELIVKLAVEGENEYYYVLSDETDSGTISINVVDAMLSEKYRTRNTQPDPGYNTGWKYDGEQKNCAFHILAKGPDGEQQTGELIVKSISISNDQAPIEGVSLDTPALEDGMLKKLKGSDPVELSARVEPSSLEEQSFLWSSSDPSIVSVDADGSLSFESVGTATITARVEADQSKSASLDVRTLSGFEDVEDLKAELAELDTSGSDTDRQRFLELYRTRWGEDIHVAPSFETSDALIHRLNGETSVLENYFDADNTSHIEEAQSRSSGETAYLPYSLGDSTATVYRLIDGELHESAYDGEIGYAYAEDASGWSTKPGYQERSIVVWDDGTVDKYGISMLNTEWIAEYEPSDFGDGDLWTIPDRNLQSEDPVIHALSPASVSLQDGAAVIRQNKYPEAKYSFGGLVSEMLTTNTDEVEMVLDIEGTTQKNEFVKTMWEVKILYYDEAGNSINSNPLKVASGNEAGEQVIRFDPSYDAFRLYLVANGSDIGEQFEDAEIEVGMFRIYGLED